MRGNRDRQFNDGKTLIRQHFSIPNNCWFVWRDDNGNVSQQMLTTHQTKAAADQDFERRCEFLGEVLSLAERKEDR